MYYIIPSIFLVISIIYISINYILLFKIYYYKERHSFAPIIGGVSGFIGIFLLPLHGVVYWCWIPLVIDMGTFPIVFYIIHIFKIIFKNDK
jgi:hypothetical protein